MPPYAPIETPRVKLRQWQPADYAHFAALNADPIVMEFFPALLSEEQSNAMAAKIQAAIADRVGAFGPSKLKKRVILRDLWDCMNRVMSFLVRPALRWAGD
jgi:RimJ/RimL family protein N-acetyltransferase